MKRPDEVRIEDAYAAALVEVARLQERLILGQALISRLKKEVARGPANENVAGDADRDDPPQYFSD